MASFDEDKDLPSDYDPGKKVHELVIEFNIVKNKGREQKDDIKDIQKVLKRPSSKKQVDNCF